MSTYLYWCNQIATFLVATIGIFALLLIAIWMADKGFTKLLQCFRIHRLFIDFVWQHYGKGGDR